MQPIGIPSRSLKVAIDFLAFVITTNMYEITYDRSQKAIVSVKHTQEGIDADKELQEDMPEKVTPVKREPKKIIKPKSKDDDDDDEPEDKPVKGKQKDDDD